MLIRIWKLNLSVAATVKVQLAAEQQADIIGVPTD
jgi:hypothetical protein